MRKVEEWEKGVLILGMSVITEKMDMVYGAEKEKGEVQEGVQEGVLTTMKKYIDEIENNVVMGKVKTNEGKLRMDLVPPEAEKAIAEVLTFSGTKKYRDRDWENGKPWGMYYGALRRHLMKWVMGEKEDPESGLSHLKHALCSLAILVTYEERGVGEDDVTIGWVTKYSNKELYKKREMEYDPERKWEMEYGQKAPEPAQSPASDLKRGYGSPSPHKFSCAELTHEDKVGVGAAALGHPGSPNLRETQTRPQNPPYSPGSTPKRWVYDYCPKCGEEVCIEVRDRCEG